MPKQPLKILFASYECAPFYKSGGLADVAGSLPKAIKKLGADIRVIMPYYKIIKKNYPQIKRYKANLSVNIAGKELKLNIFKSSLPGSRVIIYFIDVKEYFQVKNIFDQNMKPRFIAFAEIVVHLLNKNYLNWQPQIIHTNDWQTGIIPVKVKLLNLNYQTLFTIHNIGYAGRTNLEVLKTFNFNQSNFSQLKNGKVNIVREAILSAYKINTVSPTYAHEILTRDYGYDMAKALRQRQKDLSGILNGIDDNLFNPAKDAALIAKYDLKRLDKKINNKLFLQKISLLPINPSTPVLGMVSRLAGQKGFDILADILKELMQLDIQLIILGTGEKRYEDFFSRLNKKYPTKFKTYIKFDRRLARQIYAGADMFLMPSLYEPCGLGQMIAMKYGTVPIVRATGGLKDTVEKLQIIPQFKDGNSPTSGKDISHRKINYKLQKNVKFQILNIKKATGFSFNKYDGQELLKTIQQAAIVYQNQKTWQKLIKNGMQKDFSWYNSAKEYLKLYRKMLK